MEELQQEERDDTYAPVAPASMRHDDESDSMLAAAVDDRSLELPAQIRVGKNGRVGVCQNVAFCNQPGWKKGCVGGVGEIRGGNDKVRQPLSLRVQQLPWLVEPDPPR